MTSPAHAIATETGRWYKVPGFGDEFISVTNVLGIISAPAITNAAAKRAAECAVNQEALWHAIQQEDGDTAAIDYIKSAPRRHMRERGDLGTAVHHACEAYTLGRDLGEMDTEVASHLEAYKRWMERDEPEIIAVERTVFNPEYGYAGTADMVVRLDGKTYIGDIKSGFVAGKAALQMCAYAKAPMMVDGDVSKLVPWGIDGAFVLDLKPGKFSVKFCDIGEDSWRAFRAAMCLWSFNERKDVFGARWKA